MADWTPDEDKQLERLARAGHTASQIAALMQRTKNAVIGRASRLFGSLGALTRRVNPLDAYKSGTVDTRKAHPRYASHVPVSATLAVTGCRWIEDGAYCDRPIALGKKYAFCPHHMKIAFRAR